MSDQARVEGPEIFKEIYDFLERLQAHNQKEWMDEHRDEYHHCKDLFSQWLIQLASKLKKVDPDFLTPVGKPHIFWINNNLVFHPDRPTYKDHFSGELDEGENKSFFYLHFGLSETFVAGGFYRPDRDTLEKIRKAIDYDGERLKEIVNKASFVDTFGPFEDEEALKTSPKGYSKDHRHIDLLRFKNFTASHTVKKGRSIPRGLLR